MSRIDDLIATRCPNGVEYRALGDVARLVRGNGMPKVMLTDEGVGAIHYGQIYTRYGAWTTSTYSFVTVEDAEKLAKAEPGDLIITNTSENIEDVGKAVAWLGDSVIVTGGHATVIKHDLEPKYLSYWFQSPSFVTQKRALATGTKVIDVSARQLMKVRVPVPPLEVQREIVRILDQFSQLEAELEAELEARHRQYGHYRDLLLTDSRFEGVRWVPMSELGVLIRGRRFTRADVVEGGIPSIHYGEIYTRYGVVATETFTSVREELRPRLRFAEPSDVVIAAVGETVEDVGKAVAWLGKGPVAIHDDTFLFRSELEPRFVSHFMQSSAFNRQKEQFVARAKIKRLSGDGLGRILVPVLPREEQDRVVDLLEKFEALVNDLSVGLPAELAARRKQYEHYRDRLLTFTEAS